jgi:indolepyruvate ferredoxin oxidoreductase
MNPTEQRFIQEQGIQVFTGTELLLKGALEAGAALLTGYPGSPVADFFSISKATQNLLKEKGIVYHIANNEALGVARLNGSQMEDIRAMVVMKSVGAHVASDGLALGNLSKTGHKGGALVVMGDDPWSDSTQIPSDSRFLSRHLHMPVLEPATFQEIKDWIEVGFEISKMSDLYMTYLLTTNLADGGGTVEVRPNRYPKLNATHPTQLETRTIPVTESVVLSPRTAIREETLKKRFEDALLGARRFGLNQIFHASNKKKPFGFVTSGLSYQYLEHALRDMGLAGEYPILKLGMSYPVDPAIVLEFLNHVEEIIVVEEKRCFIEEQINLFVMQWFQQEKLSKPVKVWGKSLPFGFDGLPEVRGFNVSVLIEHLGPVLKKVQGPDARNIEREEQLIRETSRFEIQIPSRTPTFCPGCPHRDSASVFKDIRSRFLDKDYMRRHYNRGPIDLVFHGDTGCYTMLMFDPNSELMHNYSGMGLGVGTGAGIDPFITNKQVVFMGDSTFFHSGMIAISDAIKHHQDIMIVILDNDTTAMTGHQPTPGQDVDVSGNKTYAQRIEEVVRGLSFGSEIPVYKMDPSYRKPYERMIEQVVLQDGVKIVIAEKECGITAHRRKVIEESKVIRQTGFMPEKTYVNITPDVCEFCLECTRATGCPGLTIVDTFLGPKIETDLTWCVSDGACTKRMVCPAFEEVTVTRKEKVEFLAGSVDTRKDMPPPPLLKLDDHWSAYVAGVGGMGIGLITAILVRAGLQQGYHVHFSEKKGLAIRNGGVYSHIIYTQKTEPISPIIPYGKANLLIGLDILEAARSLDPKVNLRIGSPQYTTAVINTEKMPTIAVLMGKEDFESSQLESMIRRYTRPDRYFGSDISEVSEKLLGDKLHTNLMLLGIAFQKGELPLDVKSIISAIEMTVKPAALSENLKAFELGRKIALSPGMFLDGEPLPPYRELLEEKYGILKKRIFRGKLVARRYRSMVEEAVETMGLDEEWSRHLALRVYELIQFENLKYARRYLQKIQALWKKDSFQFGLEATKAAIQYLHKVMIIKDEVYVAHQLTSVEKKKRDQARYNIDEKRGDRITYSHMNRPEINLGPWAFKMTFRTQDWMLNIMKYGKILRRLLPFWHLKERQFRKWYELLVTDFRYHDQASYKTYVDILNIPQEVRGYREIRYPKMKQARHKVRELLKNVTTPRGTDDSHPQVISITG